MLSFSAPNLWVYLKNSMVLFKDNDPESVGWSAAPQPQTHPPPGEHNPPPGEDNLSPGEHNHLLSVASWWRFLPQSRTYHSPGMGCLEAVWTPVTYAGQNCLWHTLPTHRKFNQCTSWPEAEWPKNPTKWEVWLIKPYLLKHLPELQPVQFRNSPETEPTHKYWELIVRTSFASQGTCDYSGKYILSSQFNSWLAEVIDCQVWTYTY